MKGNFWWLIIAGIIGGFAFAAGSSLEAKTEARFGIGNSTAGEGGPGSRTANTPGVY